MKNSINKEKFSLNLCSVMPLVCFVSSQQEHFIASSLPSAGWMNYQKLLRLLKTFCSALFQKFFILLSGEIYITV